MEATRRQILFLVDASSFPQVEEEVQLQHTRAVCLSCCRILMHLSGFPSVEEVGKLKWNYELLGVIRDTGGHSRVMVKRFQDFRSELLDAFYKDTEECLQNARDPSKPFQTQSVVYNGLAGAVQDYLWEAPELTSPVRLSKRRCKKKKGSSVITSSSSSLSHNNAIFLFSSLPVNQAEADEFCGEQEVELEILKKKIEDMIPAPLVSQLMSKDIALHWVELSSLAGKNTNKVQ